ncbi:hypothetical protein [Cronobacter sakazakii]|uniref:hypothetical protein n=1 Tax=Cronobacter sakazakii TaxID=28141 RepID=UPI0005C832BB|nr:hypothetical protein [Cronobacter sakazakii]EGT4310408.1 hypothetical protein [Cronobacter sakazakii]ELY2859493.1 hypothetical protein [Cronobacter sakazakii]
MALSYAFALAAITQQINKMQESVNGAFKPLISTVACEAPRRLDTEEAFRRCTAIAQRSQALEEMAREGMQHLQTLRQSHAGYDAESVAVIPHLEGLAKASRSAKLHLLDMFAEAEKSAMWQGSNFSMLKPLKKKYVRALTAIENIAIQMAAELRQRQPFSGELVATDISRKDAIDLIKSSHAMHGAEPPKWM